MIWLNVCRRHPLGLVATIYPSGEDTANGPLHRLPTSVLIISILSRKWMWKLAVVPFNEFKMHISLSLSWSSVSFHENACGNWQLFRLMNLRCSRCLIYGQCAFLGLAKPSELQCRCFLIWTARCKLRLWWMFPLLMHSAHTFFLLVCSWYVKWVIWLTPIDIFRFAQFHKLLNRILESVQVSSLS